MECEVGWSVGLDRDPRAMPNTFIDQGVAVKEYSPKNKKDTAADDSKYGRIILHRANMQLAPGGNMRI